MAMQCPVEEKRKRFVCDFHETGECVPARTANITKAVCRIELNSRHPKHLARAVESARLAMEGRAANVR
jgi:hypothetical protein